MIGPSIASGLWVRRYQPSPDSAVRLVCLPHAGGSASFFQPVARALTRTVDVLAVQYPGRQDRYAEPCIIDLRELAGHVFEAIKAWTDIPLALFGHSMGATVAFEVALRLEQELGVTPTVLFASGRRAPSQHRDEPVHLHDDNSLIAELLSLNGTDPNVLRDDEIRRMVLPAVRADYQAVETYRYEPGPKLKCRVVALVGDRDPRVSVADAKAWDEHTTGSFELRTFSGGHFYLVDELQDVLAVLATELTKTAIAGSNSYTSELNSL
ncbi:thioesterase II family protein [Nocardia sp. NPDC088792]|uniref:thioesterase II family protein n=1 Tax=Nocardia sp. NPDC088792 TaxID=3364332 RepID=UPI0037F67FB9